MRLLLIEDNPTLCDAVAQYFKEAGFVIDVVQDGGEGLWAAKENAYDVVLLDLNLPSLDGMEILHRLRTQGSTVSVLVLSARDGLEDRIEALNAGADDYLVKPFALAEVLARVHALMRRRSGEPKSPELRIGGLTVQPASRSVSMRGEPVELTRLEYRLLELLARREGEVVTRAEIWERVFEDSTGGSSNAVEVYIAYLRKKLHTEGEPGLIHTRRGHGYILQEVAK